jgi:hypothetical protein
MPKTSPTSAIVRAVLLGQDAESLVTTSQDCVTADFEGLLGDKHRGFTRLADSRTPWYPRGVPIRNDRQVSIVSVEELNNTAQALGLPHLQAEWLGANLLLEGLPDLSLTPPNTRLFFPSGAVLIVTTENHPCKFPGQIIARETGLENAPVLFPNLAIHKRGVVACVEHPGVIAAGEIVKIKV